MSLTRRSRQQSPSRSHALEALPSAPAERCARRSAGGRQPVAGRSNASPTSGETRPAAFGDRSRCAPVRGCRHAASVRGDSRTRIFRVTIGDDGSVASLVHKVERPRSAERAGAALGLPRRQAAQLGRMGYRRGLRGGRPSVVGGVRDRGRGRPSCGVSLSGLLGDTDLPPRSIL